MKAANKMGERVRPSRKQIVADLSCDDSTSMVLLSRKGRLGEILGGVEFP